MNIFLKTLLSVVVLGGLCLSVFIAVRAPRKGKRPLVVGMMSGWAPFMVVNNQGAYEGFDVDVAQEIGKRLGCDVEIQDIGSLAALLLALEQGSIDCALSGLDITQARLQKMRMIPYTGAEVTSLCLLFNQKIPQGVASIQDLQRLGTVDICVEPGSSQEKFLDQFPWVTPKPLSKVEEMVLDVTYGKSLAMLVEQPVGRRLAQQCPALVPCLVPLLKDFQTFGMGIALQKNNNKLAQQIEAVVKQMRADGVLTRLEQQWNLIAEVP